MALPPPLSPERLLALWELGLAASRRQRDDALLDAAGLQPVPQALGQRQVGLLAAQAQWFGPALALHSQCPGCAETLSWHIAPGDLAEALVSDTPRGPGRAVPHPEGQLWLRAPQADDIDCALAAGEAGFADALLAACVIAWQPADGQPTAAAVPDAPPLPVPAPAGWPADVRQAALAELEALDPAASLSFALQCPRCSQGWDAPLDIGDSLWRSLQAAAERLLQEVDHLARAYGWREADILALSPVRRAAYLHQVLA